MDLINAFSILKRKKKKNVNFVIRGFRSFFRGALTGVLDMTREYFAPIRFVYDVGTFMLKEVLKSMETDKTLFPGPQRKEK